MDASTKDVLLKDVKMNNLYDMMKDKIKMRIIDDELVEWRNVAYCNE